MANQTQQLDPRELGARLRSGREAASLTLQALGDASGVDPGYLSRLERGRGKRTSHRILGKAAHALGLTIADLTGEGETDTLADPPSVVRAQGWARWAPALADSEMDAHLADLAALSPAGRADCLAYARWRRQQESSGSGPRPWQLADPTPLGDPRILGSDPAAPTASAVERKAS